MKIVTALAVCALGMSQGACFGNAAAATKDLTALIKTLQDDKACDRVRDVEIGGGAGQMGGEVHNSFKEHSECGTGHGAQGLKVGKMVAPATGPMPTIPPN